MARHSLMNEVYLRASALLPRGLVDYVTKELAYGGVNVESKSFVGFLVVIGFALAFMGGAVALNILVAPVTQWPFIYIGGFVATVLLYTVIIYYWLSQISASKGGFAEKVLPDALQLIASNIKSGLTTERALIVSARPEFGPLSDELRDASRKMLAGARMEDVLLDIPKRLKSKTIERTMWLLSNGIKSGGQIANLLLQLGDDLRDEQALKQEISANVSMYVMLIVVSAALGAPMLFGISSFIVGVLTEQTSQLNIDEAAMTQASARSPIGGFIGVPKSNIDPEFVTFFSQIALLATVVFACLTIGVINTGRKIDGMKMFPFIFVVAFVAFHVIRSGLASVFKTLF